MCRFGRTICYFGESVLHTVDLNLTPKLFQQGCGIAYVSVAAFAVLFSVATICGVARCVIKMVAVLDVCVYLGEALTSTFAQLVRFLSWALLIKY